ncbi:MAG TPA: hypothetical protein VJR89_28360, partial [Polyangiales bacterium]|nr:hypothetical protein [Polyangiales bacterium]
MRLHIGAALRVAVWTSSWFVASSPYARAEPALHVRAQTRLELHAQHGGNLVRVEGLLSDDLDQPLPGRSVQLTLEAADPDHEQTPLASRTLRTDDTGHFVQALTRGSGRYALRARFAGDGLHEASSVSEVFDATRADVQLALLAPRVLALDDATIAIEVRASSEAGHEGLSIALHDEAGRELASGTTDAAGSFRVELEGTRLGEPGSGQLVASSAEDAAHTRGRAV